MGPVVRSDKTVVKPLKSNIPLRLQGPLAEVGDVVKVPEALLVFAGEHTRFAWWRECRRFGGELLVEVADVFLPDNGGDEGGGSLPLQQHLPVHILEADREKKRQ